MAQNPYQTKTTNLDDPNEAWWDGYDRGFLHALKAKRISVFGLWLQMFAVVLTVGLAILQSCKVYFQ